MYSCLWSPVCEYMYSIRYVSIYIINENCFVFILCFFIVKKELQVYANIYNYIHLLFVFCFFFVTSVLYYVQLVSMNKSLDFHNFKTNDTICLLARIVLAT